MTVAIDALTWPTARIGEALEAVARASGLALRDVTAPPPPSRGAALADAREVAQWIEATATWLGIDAEEVAATYADLPETLATLAPALVRVPSGGFLVLVRGGPRRAVCVLAPDGTRQSVPVADVVGRVVAADEARVAGFVDAVLESAAVPTRRRARSEAALRAHRLAGREYDGMWLVRASPGSSFVAQARALGLVRMGTRLVVAHAALYALALAAWAMLGRGVFSGVFDPGWLAGWALLLLTAVPFRLFALWGEARFALGFGQLLKQRLLHGALNLDPETMRRSGSGELLARVVEAESVEGLAVTGGVSAALAIVEVGFVVFVLSRGAGGVGHAALFLVWLALIAAGAWRVFTKRRAWTDERLRSTRELVERMLGHRTRLAQESPVTWHDGEDALLERYLDASRAMDRATIVVDAVLSRGWLVVGLLGLVPAVLEGSAPIASLAVGIGGVLLADRALRRFTSGVTSIADAALAWRVVGPLFSAGRDTDAPGVPGLVGGDGARPAEGSSIVLEARDVTFRHDGRSDPVLRGCSLVVERDARILLEGPSGGGKSTLAAVLTGMRVAGSGLLLLRGLDRASVGGPAWRRAVACAPQFHENHVLTGTFAYNLLLSNRWPPSDADMAEAHEICGELGLGDLLARMPGGLHQVVGETGWQLSHGERSRLFLARALLQRADVVVLDESFAALDPANLELALGCAVRRAPALLVIAHP